MDLERIKQKADADKVNQMEIDNKKKEAIEKFDTMSEIMSKSYNLWNGKMKVAVDKFVESYKQTLMTSGFDVKIDNPFVKDALVGRDIIATYEDATFKLSDINYEGEHMYIQNFDDLCIEFWIRLPKKVPNYLVWKDSVKVSGKFASDYGSNTIEGYKNFVNQFNTMGELEEVINKIDINIKHFSDAIEQVNEIDLVVHKFGTDDEYKDFNEFWDSIE